MRLEPWPITTHVYKILGMTIHMLLNIQGVGSAVNKLNDVVAMIAEVRSLADALASTQKQADVDHQNTVRWM